MKSAVWIVDFGSQYTQLITRKFRELGFTSEIITLEDGLERIKTESPKALVLSGGPQSVFEDKTDYTPFFENKNLPILGICYGMQIIGQYFGGKVEKGVQGEYGLAALHTVPGFLIPGCPPVSDVWMSHSDHLIELPKNFKLILQSENGLTAGIKHELRPILGLQFHPEVHHTVHGHDILTFFLNNVAELKSDWSSKTMLESCAEAAREIKGSKVLCAFSGGVDSLVAATLVHKVIGDDLHCFFVDNGLLRPQDIHTIHLLQEKTKLNIEILDASELFLKSLHGQKDPEQKRKTIGKTFIDVFEKKVHDYERDHGITFDYLLQGTLYPDVIESISPHKKGGKSVTIKSHHNVGGLPERMHLKLLEPLRFLFKDEVRAMGLELGLAHEWVYRHPFPGPGIGVRVLGELSRDSIRKVQESDQILYEELKSSNLYDSTWQAFTVLLPVKTVGVKGDGRVYEEVIALRMVNSQDGMTASVSELPWSFLNKVSSRVCNEVKGVTRVVYDITSKPPGTIEWE
ncbi:MAG TPA: glutamine-hydrolyzing GMP synthase [Bacteriovoracaceae bacterium]|nr:glutamine-hydrolyzing GMP synthase [Bacteriovoracaceae bacterium]